MSSSLPLSATSTRLMANVRESRIRQSDDKLLDAIASRDHSVVPLTAFDEMTLKSRDDYFEAAGNYRLMPEYEVHEEWLRRQKEARLLLVSTSPAESPCSEEVLIDAHGTDEERMAESIRVYEAIHALVLERGPTK